VSTWLEEFSLSKKELDLEELKDVILELCLHKDGSRLLQDVIGSGDCSQVEIIFSEIKMHVVDIANDQSGN